MTTTHHLGLTALYPGSPVHFSQIWN